MSNWRSLLKPAPAHPADPLPANAIERAYFFMRLLVGFLGLALPIFLLAGDRWFQDENQGLRGSLSEYYYSGMRDVFVGILVVVGILLLTYKVSELNRDNLFSIVAGLAAIGVAIIPTSTPEGVPPTPLQDKLTVDTAQTIHYVGAGIFIVCLLLICWDFGSREGKRSGPRGRFWFLFHRTMAGTIALGLVLIPVLKWSGSFESKAILIGETVVVVAFGLSWLAKSWNRDSLPKVTIAAA